MFRLPSVLLLLASISMARAEDLTGKIIFDNVCFTCHGSKGEGNIQFKAPAIAGEPTWYVMRQLGNFQHDRRGFEGKDVEGQLMRAMAKSLDAKKMEAVATYVSSLKRVQPTQTIVADIERGRELFSERCMECHRYNAEGEFTFGSPPLMGLQDWYIRSQILKFRTGQRGVEKTDPYGTKMSFSSGFIEDEEALDSLVAYLMSMQKKPEATTEPINDPFVKASIPIEQANASVQK